MSETEIFRQSASRQDLQSVRVSERKHVEAGCLGVIDCNLLVCDVSGNAQSVTNHCELTQQDYDVFGGLIQGLRRPGDPEEAWQGKEMLILDMTATQPPELQDKAFESYSNSQSSRSVEAFRDYSKKGHDSCVVKARFGDSQSYKIVAAKEIQDSFSKSIGKGWKEFYKKYPNSAGYWQFSRSGFNSARDTAWLYVVHACSGLCGTGHLYLLSKENGHWTVKYRLMLWIS